jgi:CheY-like chemotaxis protein
MCILLVEDEPLIRSIMADEFLDAGFRVIEAQDGDEAIAILADPPTRLTLLVTDINMPGEADGMAVAARLRRDCVSVPVIFTTGHPESAGSPARDGWRRAHHSQALFAGQARRPRAAIDRPRGLGLADRRGVIRLSPVR